MEDTILVVIIRREGMDTLRSMVMDIIRKNESQVASLIALTAANHDATTC
jgi:hypothetical protein